MLTIFLRILIHDYVLLDSLGQIYTDCTLARYPLLAVSIQDIFVLYNVDIYILLEVYVTQYILFDDHINIFYVNNIDIIYIIF